jgi:hypothetical protein
MNLKKLSTIIKEAVHINEMSSGWLKKKDMIENVHDFVNGSITVEIGNKSYKAKRVIKSLDLRKGMLFAAYYNADNQGFDIYEFLGVSGNEQTHGDGGVKYNSVKECLLANNVRSLSELEALDDKYSKEKGYGHSHDMWVKDINDNESGPWFYLSEGKWCRGSGAEPLKFVEVELV